ncbi:MAG: serine/threonine-protein phosphatase [Kofleriaceae bacterium]|nr:serine/threonine-protein phosphatase [Kofleriaceae bacterium]MCB9574363.1 serine/threonine-protein phosphatase [Kofleriaceae bacterium]
MLAFSPLSLPYFAAAACLATLGVITIVVRGDVLARLAILMMVAALLPWSLAFGLVGCTQDPVLAEQLLRLGLAPCSLIGPCLMVLVLSISGRFDDHRLLSAVAFAAGLTAAILCWATDWVVAGVRPTPSGFLFIRSGWMQSLHIGQIPAWGILGVLVSRRGMRVDRNQNWRLHRQRMIIIVALSLISLLDLALSEGWFGWYPAAWIAAVGASLVGIHSIFRADLLRARGIDRAAAVELALLIGVTLVLYAVVWRDNRTWTTRPVAAAVFSAPLPMLGLVASWTLRIRRRRAERTSDAATLALDAFSDELEDLTEERPVAVRLRELLEGHTQVSAVRVWLAGDDGGLVPVVPEDLAPLRIDARIRTWMVANPEPLVVAELAAIRLGGLRGLAEDLIGGLVADVVVPLCDRETLVGLAVGNLPAFRVLNDAERDFVRAAATTAARGMTFVALTREAGHLAETQREVEVAEAVQQARAVGDTVVDAEPWQILVHYRPAARVAGDVWLALPLGDGKVLVFVGDVVGRGVPAALVSAAVGGVCEAAAAMTGPALEPRALLELVHQTVRDIAGGAQRVTAFAAVLDHGARTVRFACAGHRGAYVVRPVPGEARARLDVLHARGTALGEPQPMIGVGERPLELADVVVACSDGVVEVRAAVGEPWGERRLQRVLRGQVLDAGDRAARMIVQAAVAHAGDAQVHDDMLVLVARAAEGPDVEGAPA